MNTPVHRRSRGFSLIEVLVALIIIGVGMLGIAKIQALAYASTGTAAARSIAAIEASSLAAAMRANRDYWTTAAAGGTQTITTAAANVTASTDGSLLAPGACGAAACNMQQLAAYDLKSWATSLNSALPGSSAIITCVPPTAAVPVEPAGYPIGCTIQITWIERSTGINAQSQGTVMAAPTYTLYVEP
ncbi:MAG: type IV pilus modification protein PilV [Steroidobacteraceae bacterium]